MNKKLLGLLALTSSITLASGFHGDYETKNTFKLNGYATYLEEKKQADAQPQDGPESTTGDNALASPAAGSSNAKKEYTLNHGLEDKSPSLETEHHVRLLFHDADFMVFGGANTGLSRNGSVEFSAIGHYFGGRVDTKVGKGFSVALTGAYKSDKTKKDWFKNAILKQTALKKTNAELKYGYEEEENYTTLFSAAVYGEHEGAKLNFGTVHISEDFKEEFKLKSFGFVSKDFGIATVDSSLIHELNKDNLVNYGKLNGEIKLTSDKVVDKLNLETIGKFEMQTIKATNEDGDRKFSYGLENKAVYKGIDKLSLTGFVNYNADVNFEKLGKNDDSDKSHIVNKLKVGYELDYNSDLKFNSKSETLTTFKNKIKKTFDNEETFNYFDTKNTLKYDLSKGGLKAVADFHNKAEFKGDVMQNLKTFLFVGGLGENAKFDNFEHSLDARLGFKVSDRSRTNKNTPDNFVLTGWTKNKVSKNVTDKVKLMGELNAHTYVFTNHKNTETSKEFGAVVSETKLGLEYKSGKHMFNQDFRGRHLASILGNYEDKNNAKKFKDVSVEHLAQVNSDTKYTYQINDDAKFRTSFAAEYRYNETKETNAYGKNGSEKAQKVQLSDKLYEAITRYVENAGRAKRDELTETDLYYTVREFANKEEIEYWKDKVEGNKEEAILHALRLKYALEFDLTYLDKKLTITPGAEVEAKMAGVDKTNFLDPKFESKATLNLNYKW